MLENNRLNLNQLHLGEKLPPWNLVSIDPSDMLPKVEDFKGKPLLILIFSFSCPGCLGRAVPYANRLVYEHGNDINVLGIHTDYNAVNFDNEFFEFWKKELFIRFPIYKDYNYDTTFLNYGAGGTPHWILVDKDSIVRYSIFGSDPNNALLRLDLKLKELNINTI
ncbi:MAG TPA: TlpA disulfide reductase family protein [Saprospiraceae bacterium]|nr:TlpA family protein disulfide reductase [Saprospiraceae bacterium]MCB9327477.1 TlpA family protein disulfide reductase [Lewinellaceae bacterium]HPK10151.1 TlpA disulfide reductase family protein [Saprospiraceae bacterium]HPQ22178.1 TlpA disulfide reductase family protein [Saprospiraceae bacterium]